MNYLKSILLNRNFILILSVIAGLTIGDFAIYFKKHTLYMLAFVMIFSTSGISFSSLFPITNSLKIMFVSTILTYFVLSGVMLLSAWFIIGESDLFYGFAVIAASPPGVAVIPFSYMLNGRLNYSVIGVLGGFIASIVIAPLIITFFAGGNIAPATMLWMMTQIVIIPLLLSRVLLIKKIKPVIEKIRGQVVNWGFALIIFTAVGVNRNVFFNDFQFVLKPFLVLFISIFVLGTVFEWISKKLKRDSQLITTQTLMLTIKSSGFSATTALILLDSNEAAIPSAVLSIMILLYLLFQSFKKDLSKKK